MNYQHPTSGRVSSISRGKNVRHQPGLDTKVLLSWTSGDFGAGGGSTRRVGGGVGAGVGSQRASLCSAPAAPV